MLYAITPAAGCTFSDTEHAAVSFTLSLASHCTPNRALKQSCSPTEVEAVRRATYAWGTLGHLTTVWFRHWNPAELGGNPQS